MTAQPLQAGMPGSLRGAARRGAGRGQFPGDQTAAPRCNGCHNPVTGFPVPLRVLCHL